MALNSIEKEWEGFAAMVLPNVASGSVQYQEMKKAFFAGAPTVQTAVAEIGEDHITEAQGCKYLTDIQIELRRFRSRLLREYAERN